MLIDIQDDGSEKVKYDYPDYPIYIRRGILSVYPNYTADSHWHDDIELIVVLSGQMQYNANGDIITLNSGEGIFINAKQFHYGFSETRTECDFICILFHPILLCASKKLENEYVAPMLHSELSYVHLAPGIPWQKKALKYIQEIYAKRKAPAAPLYIQGLLCLLWNEIVTHTDYLRQNEKQTDSNLMTLKSMIAYIHENFRDKISLADIAASGHVSKRTCGTLFLKYQNKTPIEFLVDYRLRKSIELMKNTNMTILEISYAAGFSGASYYSETFRKYFGESPAVYRKQLK